MENLLLPSERDKETSVSRDASRADGVLVQKKNPRIPRAGGGKGKKRGIRHTREEDSVSPFIPARRKSYARKSREEEKGSVPKC